MAVPQRKVAPSRRDMRRANLALTATNTIPCPNCGEAMRPHRICAACGTYKGRKVLVVEEEE